jgi:hypothetical protein
MDPLIQLKTTPRILIILTLLCFTLVPQAQAVSPPPPGGYPNFTTAAGDKALKSLTSGAANTAIGNFALFSVTTGNNNTAVGAGALDLNNGESNTAVGTAAILFNTTGANNTATGTAALELNTTGSFDNAVGAFALFNNIDGMHNTAVGYQALFANVSGLESTAIGDQALLNNNGNFNVAIGGAALITNMTGNENTACGGGTLVSTTGNDNTALGFQAGISATTGDGNVYIGAGMSGVAGEANHTYVRNINSTSVNGMGTDTVTVNLTTGLLGHLSSSRRYKEEIRPMDKASEALYRLKPVTYRYKKEIDPSRSLEYGLVAEDVAQVDPNLAIRDGSGQIESVRFMAVNAMLLNEFLKARRQIDAQQKQIEALTAGLQKVSAQLEASKPAPQVVNNP